MNEMLQFLRDHAQGPMAHNPDHADTCNMLTRIADELQRLLAIKSQLPLTADGVRVVPVSQNHVYRICQDGNVQESCAWDGQYPMFRCREPDEPTHGFVGVNPILTYSTREAAEAARGKT